MKRSNLVGWAMGSVIALAGCGGGGGGGSGSNSATSCDSFLTEDDLCALDCTKGSRSTVAELYDVIGSSPALTAIDMGGGLVYESTALSCTDDNTSSWYEFDFWFLDGGLVWVSGQGTGIYASGGSSDRVSLPSCLSSCASLVTSVTASSGEER